MLPVHSHHRHATFDNPSSSTYRRSFQKIRSTPLIIKLFALFLLYLACFFIGFYLIEIWNVREFVPQLSLLPFRTETNPEPPSLYRVPIYSTSKELAPLASLGPRVKGESPLVGNAKYIQHLFGKMMRKWRREHLDAYARDSEFFTRGPDGEKLEVSAAKHPLPPKIHKPTKKQFQEFVRRGAPVVLTGIVDKWTAYTSWTDEYLANAIGDVQIPIEYSETQDFYGDIKRQKLSTLTVADFLREYRKADRTRNYYLAETSILEHFQPLLTDFPNRPYFIPDPWKLDVIQLWIGAGGQVTPSHNDESENILCQFRGARTFYVYDPLYVDTLYTTKENPVYPRVKIREGKSNYDKYPLFREAPPPLEIHIEEGECLYLPSVWYHRVESKPNARSLAINYWFIPQSSIAELVWMGMSSHEWRTSTGTFMKNRKRGEQ